jgi:hypothetical protein
VSKFTTKKGSQQTIKTPKFSPEVEKGISKDVKKRKKINENFILYKEFSHRFLLITIICRSKF